MLHMLPAAGNPIIPIRGEITRFVLPPAAKGDLATLSATNLNLFCYQYRYDADQRLIEKKIPGKGWDYLVYNQMDQVVLSQDSVQRRGGLWALPNMML